MEHKHPTDVGPSIEEREQIGKPHTNLNQKDVAPSDDIHERNRMSYQQSPYCHYFPIGWGNISL